jgi:hypothetical protein
MFHLSVVVHTAAWYMVLWYGSTGTAGMVLVCTVVVPASTVWYLVLLVLVPVHIYHVVVVT